MSNRRVKDIGYEDVDDAADYEGDFGGQQEGLLSCRDINLDSVNCS
jgi:hypothetical protein